MRHRLRQLDAMMMQIVHGHFGELIQGRIGARLALISLPCPALRVTATRHAGSGLHIHSKGLISPERARRFLATLGLGLRGRIVLDANMPIGGGAGSSTAALVALARLAGWQGGPLALAHACLRSEGATDPLMLANPAQTLWASREAVVLDQLPPLPPFDILGGFSGPIRRTEPADLHFPDISDLIPHWILAARSQDVAELAKLSTISAQRTLDLRGPADDPILGLAQRLGALGVVIAHTGSARGLIFARGQIPANGRAALSAAGLTSPVIFGYRS
jgi:uncharacterized protein involved in propanediol utilization